MQQFGDMLIYLIRYNPGYPEGRWRRDRGETKIHTFGNGSGHGDTGQLGRSCPVAEEAVQQA